MNSINNEYHYSKECQLNEHLVVGKDFIIVSA